MNRDEFRESVFERDEHTCVLCPKKATAAHHLLERRLFGEEGNWGYDIDNGVSLCDQHHLKAEICLVTVEDLRQAAGITKIIVPPSFNPEVRLDKWGNTLGDNDLIVEQGPLWDSEQYSKAMKHKFNLLNKNAY